MISVICNTYNHERYIASCLESILAQRTDVNFEIIVHDDASTDSTQQIIKKYENLHPRLIRSIFQPRNMYSKGVYPTALAFPHCRGDLIAFCEGDDFWVDPNKLAKQVHFLRMNKHRNIIGGLCQSQSAGKSVRNYRAFPRTSGDGEVSFVDGLAIFRMSEFVHLSTLLVTRDLIEYRNERFGQSLISGDLTLLLSAAILDGDIPILNNVVSNYRIHAGGSWTSRSQESRYSNYAALWEAIGAGVPIEIDSEYTSAIIDNLVYFRFMAREGFYKKIGKHKIRETAPLLRACCRRVRRTLSGS